VLFVPEGDAGDQKVQATSYVPWISKGFNVWNLKNSTGNGQLLRSFSLITKYNRKPVDGFQDDAAIFQTAFWRIIFPGDLSNFS